MNLQTPFMILSSERGGLTPERNATRTEALGDWLEASGLDYQAVEGCYYDQHEKSYLVLLPNGDAGDDYRALLEKARDYEQDYVLYVDGARFAYLDDPSGSSRSVPLGRWGAAPENYRGDHTITPDGRKWAVV